MGGAVGGGMGAMGSVNQTQPDQVLVLDHMVGPNELEDEMELVEV